jgi:hypothetical protein
MTLAFMGADESARWLVVLLEVPAVLALLDCRSRAPFGEGAPRPLRLDRLAGANSPASRE